MIPKECKRLAEVDFPIAVVSKHAAKEKSIRFGHLSTLHLWWARRPLAACRAVLLGLLLPDPCDEHCPDDFKSKARELLPKVQGQVGPNNEALRQALLKFIGDFANWDLSSDRTYLEVARSLVKAIYTEEKPLVVDPFAGGGSIPLEALRLGCETLASDLNPVACLILKILLEEIPRHGTNLVTELRDLGKRIKAAAEVEMKEFYPNDPDGSIPIAYIWARTVRCESPNCGAEIPLVGSFWLRDKGTQKQALRYRVKKDERKNIDSELEFEIFRPKKDDDVPSGTISRAKATCVRCHMVLSPERLRAQLTAQKGGGDVIFGQSGNRIGGARLLAAVIMKPGEAGRQYRLPLPRDYEAVWKAMKRLDEILATNTGVTPSLVPDEPLPLMSGTFNAPLYGMNTWGDVFTARQKVALLVLLRAISEVSISEPQKEIASLALSRITDIRNALCLWSSGGAQVVHLFGRQAIPMSWDFGETSFFGGQAGDYTTTLGTMVRVIEHVAKITVLGQVQLADARSSPLPDASCSVWFTDPPYYFAVPYADLSDFFFVWLKRALPDHPLLRDPFDDRNILTPKDQELCEMVHWDPERYAHKDQKFFEQGMMQAFTEGRRVLNDDGIGCVVFAHKTTEGWEALLSGIINGRWTITASWPIATERTGRLRARESAALATSVHLVCRPRRQDAPVGDWDRIVSELPHRVGDWMERLQSEGVRGADLVFACIGPALEIYSRYSKVVDALDREIPLGGEPEAVEPYKRGYLAYVWETVGRTALEHVLGTAEARARNSMAGALEEDARLTALFLWTLQSTNNEQAIGDRQQALVEESEEDEEEEEGESKKGKGKSKKGHSLVFDVARRFAQPLGIHLDDWEGRIIETEKGVVRLLSVTERTKQLFGEDGTEIVADELERSPERIAQLALFPDRAEGAVPEIKGRGQKKKGIKISGEAFKTRHEATTLDRVHAAMLLQASGRTNALRALLKAELDRSPDFLRLANALSALYPKGSEEKRLLDAMLLAVPR